MNWNLSKATYYADFVIAPLFMLAALCIAPLGWQTAAGAALGVGLWTFIEYCLHRWVFHKVYRREHWAHHQRPAKYIGVPPWQTGAIFVVLYLALLGLAGVPAGTGLFAGLLAGYFAYIVAHDRIHHSNIGKSNRHNIWDRMAKRHAMHHRGFEGNFGVITTGWDILFGTYRRA